MKRITQRELKDSLNSMMLNRADKSYREGDLDTAIGHVALVVIENPENNEARSSLDRYLSEAPDDLEIKHYVIRYLSEHKEPKGRRIREDSEEKLYEPSLDTDLMEFMATVGLIDQAWSLGECSTYVKEIYKGQVERRLKRISTLSKKEKLLETKIVNSLSYEYRSDSIRTIGDYKATLRKDGSSLYRIGKKGVACFNEFLKEYDL